MEGSTDSHAPVLWILPSRRASVLYAAAWASPRAVFAAYACRRWIYYLPSPTKRACYPDLK